jgi:protein O-GlcNAc transferase
LRRYDAVLTAFPDAAEVFHNRGLLLARLERLDEAERNDRAYVEAHPQDARARCLLADILLALSRYEEALRELESVAQPDALVLLRRGLALAALMRYAEARDAIAAAMAVDPHAAHRFVARLAPGSDPEVVLAPENIFLWRRYVAQRICNWTAWDEYLAEFRRALRAPEVLLDRALAFSSLHLPLDGAERLAVARRIAERIEASAPPLQSAPKSTNARLRIGVLSPDFREHLNARLLLPLFELADRTRFELFAYSLSPDDRSAIRGQVRAAADQFRDLSRLSNRDAAQQIRRDRVELLLDAAGHTTGSRFEITAMRPAPVQALYLAFPGSLGSRRVDYVIVDRTAAPRGSEKEWSEQLACVADTYYLYDFREPILPLPLTRREYDLPEAATVYCAFHKPEKITPDALDLWCAVLRQVPGSVLWGLALPPTAAANLRREAMSRGVARERLLFAPFDSRERYLARQRLGDLLLDAVHHSAMTTSCDALGAGLPVLTLRGTTFASRAGESLLRAAGLPELVAPDPDAFVRAATTLGNNRRALEDLKAKLNGNRRTAPLFDTSVRVRQLEAAFTEMWRRHQAGLSPSSFDA